MANVEKKEETEETREFDSIENSDITETKEASFGRTNSPIVEYGKKFFSPVHFTIFWKFDKVIKKMIRKVAEAVKN